MDRPFPHDRSGPGDSFRQPFRLALLRLPRDARKAVVEPICVDGDAWDCY